jgi:peptidoglycan hydrolase-like protein with peptidoglycan-binding domain
VKEAATAALTKRYDDAVKNNPKLKKFAELPAEAQTVIASVEYQYGNASTRTPKFWKWVTTQDWKSAVRELYNFGDAYESRRFTEGDLLAALVPDLPKIANKVGDGGTNDAADVKVVQQLLKDKGDYAGAVTGTADAATLAAIKAFQKKIGFAKPDGVVDPKGKTMRRLIAF